MPDLLVEYADKRIAIEVKLIYDLTYSKYYRSAAEDHGKLVRYVEKHPGTEAFAVVFFVQLPSMEYPADRWYARPKGSRARSDQLVRAGTAAQFNELCKRLGTTPITGDRVSMVTQLAAAASEDALAAATRWFAEVFEPSTTWRFDPNQHLANAAVAGAVWRVA